ncbi:unnamed protein product [Arabis nemorensis]|uniref:Uncharacterized protein n=1 Tax=Arabis nemorensis TaxID=586526 RepID=A0A565AMG5_9BRAS|nr:unnamed protein product [Arabis nemorensis]
MPRTLLCRGLLIRELAPSFGFVVACLRARRDPRGRGPEVGIHISLDLLPRSPLPIAEDFSLLPRTPPCRDPSIGAEVEGLILVESGSSFCGGDEVSCVEREPNVCQVWIVSKRLSKLN